MKNKIKDYLKITIEFIKSFFQLLIPTVRILLAKDAKHLSRVKYIKNSSKCIVLGNGPSLNNDYELILKEERKSDFCCVNNFVLSEHFIKLKPTKYIFLDNYFWEIEAHRDWVDTRNRTFKMLSEIVDWPMQVFVPIYADKKFIESKIKNDNIEIIKIKVGSIPDIRGKMAHFLFDTNFYGPGSMNVLIFAVYLSIKSSYDAIDIYGADLSFHKDVDVDQKTNKPIIKYNHFYGSESYEELTKDPQKKENFTMYEFMNITTKTFFAHEVLSSYAKKLNIKIINKSSQSLIDSYDRV